MITISVKNVGPIKDAQLDLKKFNILIGQQGTGKSTLAKIACYCSWVEKEICIAQSVGDFSKEGFFERNLTEFHKLDSYITEKSIITYKSDVLRFQWLKKKFSFKWLEGRLTYKRRKTLYIPAERNVVSIIPNWFEVNLGQNSTRSFLADWERVRKYFSKDRPLPLLNLGSYYHNTSDKSDHILTEDGKDILIGNASSGFQSLTPLQALIRYYGDVFYSKDLISKESNIYQQSKFEKLFQALYIQLLEKMGNDERTAWETTLLTLEKNDDSILRKQALYPNDQFEKDLLNLIINMQQPYSTSFFIEEPELNLYPITQYNLINSLVELINKKSHTLFITTHSTYILTSLNNLIFAGEKAEIDPVSTARIIPKKQWIKRSDVSAWKINATSNQLENLLDSNLPMLKAEELDDVSQTINNKFDALFDISESNGNIH